MREEYLNIYDDSIYAQPKITWMALSDLLQAIENKDLKWGIVTNKPRRFTNRLIESMRLHLRASLCSERR